jgi:hypothetical protein
MRYRQHHTVLAQFIGGVKVLSHAEIYPLPKPSNSQTILMQLFKEMIKDMKN